MMENDEETGDDQGTGWFEVKKKHRAGSKLCIQKVLGGSSNRSQSSSPHYQAPTNEEFGNLHSRRQVQTLKADLNLVVESKGSADSMVPTSSEGDPGMDSYDKLAINRGSEPAKTPMKDADLMCGTKPIHEASSQEKSDNVPITKFCDLVDVRLALHKCRDDSDTSANTGCSDVADGNTKDHGNSMKDVVISEDIMLSLVVQEESLEGASKEVNDIPSKVKESGKDDSKDAVGKLGKGHDGGDRTESREAGVDSGSNNTAAECCLTPPIEEDERISLQDPCDIPQYRALSNCDSSVMNENAGMEFGPDIILFPDQKSDAEVSVNPSSTFAMDQRGAQGDSSDSAVVGEGEVEESKERFRERLWCFLFENLNRAVDELYLLCELECDMEQMNEAILVLEEAASDFRELKCRVGHFENAKRSSCQSSKDGTPVNVKTDNRRPHALSWEVRRMTTSPRRAEILSSSLEAFKKIQQERAMKHVTHDAEGLEFSHSTQHVSRTSPGTVDVPPNATESGVKSKKTEILDADQGNTIKEKQNAETTRLSKSCLVQNVRLPPQSQLASTPGKFKKESREPTSEIEKQIPKRDRVSAGSRVEKNLKSVDMVKKNASLVDKEKEKEREKRNTAPWKSMDAWKEKRNWEDILKSPLRNSSRVSHSPGMNRKGMERARVLHDKLMSPEKKKKSALDMKREAEEKHARAMRIRSQLENERVQRLQRTSEKLNRVNEWQAVRSLKLREGMYARHQRSESRHEAYLAQVARRAGDESSKVNEVRFITSLNEGNKKLMLRQKLHDSEVRRAEKLQVIRTKQKEDMAREEAVLERRKLLEAEKLQRLAEIQRKKEEAQVRREEERKASSAAREAKAVEQLRRKEERAKAQQEEAELLAQRLAEKLSESEQRRKYYLEQIREKASMDFRDQSSPLLRRSLNKEGQSRSISTNSIEDYQTSCISSAGDSALGLVNATQQHPLKRRIKKIRQRLMALKYEFTEPPISAENTGVGYRALVGAARAKIGRWLQELQRLRQARKEGAASIGLIVGDMVKFLEGKDPELHASRQAGLPDFISSALPASHTSKPEACQVMVYLLRLLRVIMSVPANRSYFLAQNLLPPIIPMLSASLENYIKIVASSSPGNTNLLSNKTTTENLESIAEALDGFLWTVTAIMGHVHSDERQLQMQDGLMELIVAYQVIHRLRDLFALYDRPQVEGSPFPSSILLSLNLLAVLTSRSGAISSIDWDSCISKTESLNSFQEPENVGSLGLGDSSVENNHSGDYTSPPTVNVVEDIPANEYDQSLGEEKLLSSRVSLSAIQDGRPLDGECRKESSVTLINLDKGEAASQLCQRSTSGQSHNIKLEDHAKSLLPQKDEKNSTCSCAEKKAINECTVHVSNETRKESRLKQPVVYLLSAIAETGLVSLPSLLTGVLLQANNRLSSEQASYILPSNFEEVAVGVLKVLNNLAILDIALLQNMLARSDLKMEFFHLMSFLLSHCSSRWKATNDQVGLLLLECLLLLGYFALFHPGNQAVLRWGKTPTILHKVCDLPFVFFSDPELTPILAVTLVAACYGCEQNKGVVEQELNTDMLLSLLKSCRQSLLTSQFDSSPVDVSVTTDPCDASQTATDARKSQGDFPVRSNRKITRVSSGKGATGINARVNKTKTQKDTRGTKTCDEWAIKHNLPASQASSKFMLHRRFPSTFLDKAAEFFSSGTSSLPI